MRTLQQIAIGLALLALTGCASLGGAAQKPSSGDQSAEPLLPMADAPALLVLSENCPISTVKGGVESIGSSALAAGAIAVIGAVAQPLIETAVVSVANYLDSRAMALNASTTATARNTLFRRTTAEEREETGTGFRNRHQCLTFIRGGWAPNGIKDQGQWAGHMMSVNGILKEQKYASRLVTRPEIYAEFEIVYESLEVYKGTPPDYDPGSPDKPKTAKSQLYQGIGIRPLLIDYGKIGAERTGEGSKTLLFKISMDSRSPRLKSGETPTFYSSDINLGKVKENAVIAQAALEYKTPKMMRIPQPAVIEIKDEAGKKVLGKTDDLIPFTVEVSLLETEQGGDFERAAAAALRAKKADIAKAAATPLTEELAKIINRGLGVKP